MKIKFWGVRGSIASPGSATAGVGGNTSCVEICAGGSRIILDAGTGLRNLGEKLAQDSEPTEATLLLSHTHWDHIQGLPFFVPLYQPSTRLAVVGVRAEEMSLSEVVESQMRSPVFPVAFADTAATVGFRHIASTESLHVGECKVTAQKLNHPGGVLAYRIDWKGRSVVYATDTEHYSCVDPHLVRLAKGADVLIYDAQYTTAEYRGENGPSRVGWGHSTWEAGVEVAEAAGVAQLQLFHHAPHRSDREVLAIEKQAQQRFRGCIAAREGAQFELPAEGSSVAA